MGAMIGKIDGTARRFECPEGHVFTTITGTATDKINSMQFTCTDGSKSEVYGTPAGAEWSLDSADHGFHLIQGYASDVGVTGFKTTNNGASLTPSAFSSVVGTAAAPRTCADNWAQGMVDVWAGQWVSGMSVYCKEYTKEADVFAAKNTLLEAKARADAEAAAAAEAAAKKAAEIEALKAETARLEAEAARELSENAALEAEKNAGLAAQAKEAAEKADALAAEIKAAGDETKASEVAAQAVELNEIADDLSAQQQQLNDQTSAAVKAEDEAITALVMKKKSEAGNPMMMYMVMFFILVVIIGLFLALRQPAPMYSPRPGYPYPGQPMY
jgi:hypothetical protein